MSSVQDIIPGPPKVTGDIELDFPEYINWLQEFYKALVLERIAQVAGQFTITETNDSATITMPVTGGQPQPDADYRPIICPADFEGTPGADAFIVQEVYDQTTSQFSVTLRAAPGAGNSVTFNYFIARL